VEYPVETIAGVSLVEDDGPGRYFLDDTLLHQPVQRAGVEAPQEEMPGKKLALVVGKLCGHRRFLRLRIY
jgi:hypothetical protein